MDDDEDVVERTMELSPWSSAHPAIYADLKPGLVTTPSRRALEFFLRRKMEAGRNSYSQLCTITATFLEARQ